ncbi:GerAB/ArcD/ProY family transporter [Bacillus mycoides]|uniref:GerAB/ArcD/ProY family transporter n=1 Tax=Bacillus mycoides TaxID=1405 RepID=UPI0021130539|nr:GerAB/ArcD/ProY family transporter [Bacillus mycoides]MCQ6530708.1 spore germination protein [Bacillus mycoides]
MNPKYQLSGLQFFFFIVQTQIGIAVLSLPYAVFQHSRTDSWLTVILAGICVNGCILIMWFLAKRFPKDTIFEIIKIVFGIRLGRLFTISYIIYFIFIISTILSLFSNIIQLWLLPNTPSWIPKLLLLCIGIYVAKDNIKIIARFFVLTAIFLFFFLFLSMYALKDANFFYILPVGKNGIDSILKGVHEGFLSFLGFEIFMILFPYIQTNATTKLRIALAANMFTTFFYTILTLICLLFFSPKEMKIIPQPILYLIKSFEFKIVERPDILFTSTWIILISSTIMAYLYGASRGLQCIYEKYKRKTFVYGLSIISFIVTLIFNTPAEANTLSHIVSKIGLIFSLGLPLFLLIFSLLRNKTNR